MEQLDINEGNAVWVIDMWMPEGMKRCGGDRKSGIPPHRLEATSDNFYRDAIKSDGLQSRCKDCANKKTVRWGKDNPDKVAVHKSKWVKNNPDKVATKNARHRAAHRRRNARVYSINPQEFKHCPGLPAAGTLPHDAVKGDFNRSAASSDGLDTKCKECAKAYNATPAAKLSKARSRAKRSAAYSEDYDFQQIWVDNGRCCHICDQYVSPPDAAVDHVYPLSKGGHDVESNVLPAHSTCNTQKNGRTMQQLEDEGILDNWFRNSKYDPKLGRVVESE